MSEKKSLQHIFIPVDLKIMYTNKPYPYTGIGQGRIGEMYWVREN